jgi:hypothetical protein
MMMMMSTNYEAAHYVFFPFPVYFLFVRSENSYQYFALKYSHYVCSLEQEIKAYIKQLFWEWNMCFFQLFDMSPFIINRFSYSTIYTNILVLHICRGKMKDSGLNGGRHLCIVSDVVVSVYIHNADNIVPKV